MRGGCVEYMDSKNDRHISSIGYENDSQPIRVCSPSIRSLPFKVISPATLWLYTVYTAVPHLVRGLAAFLCKDNLEGSAFDHKVVHFDTSFSRHFMCGILDERKALRLMRVIVHGDVYITDFSNTTKRHLQILRHNVRRQIPDQKRHARWAFIAASSASTTSHRRHVVRRAAVWRWGTTTAAATVVTMRWAVIIHRWRRAEVPSASARRTPICTTCNKRCVMDVCEILCSVGKVHTKVRSKRNSGRTANI